MTAKDAIAWFEEIDRRAIPRTQSGTYLGSNRPAYHYDDTAAMTWLIDAQSALEAVFPSGHAVIKSWHTLVAKDPVDPTSQTVIEGAQGIFKSALAQLKAGRLSTLVEGVRAESTNELLDQAASLLAGGYLVAAAVIAGGALEMHLLHLCNRHQLKWPGEGSISKYDAAIAQARNTGTVVYSASDSKLVVAWGGIRNDAAHSPASFNRSASDVERMIQSIQEFVARSA